MTRMIEVRDVSKIYVRGAEKVTALESISLHADTGAFVALAGPSGSGKTTLLNVIGTLTRPDKGEVWVGGERVDDLDENATDRIRRKRLGFVFQDFNLIPVFSALENVELALYFEEPNKALRRQRSLAMLDAVGLGDRVAHRPNQLSGGEQQRVAVARALVHGPDLVLADEPTANLDATSAFRLLQLMEEMKGRLDTVFLFSTHDDRVLEVADRVIFLEDGRLVQ